MATPGRSNVKYPLIPCKPGYEKAVVAARPAAIPVTRTRAPQPYKGRK